MEGCKEKKGKTQINMNDCKNMDKLGITSKEAHVRNIWRMRIDKADSKRLGKGEIIMILVMI